MIAVISALLIMVAYFVIISATSLGIMAVMEMGLKKEMSLLQVLAITVAVIILAGWYFFASGDAAAVSWYLGLVFNK